MSYKQKAAQKLALRERSLSNDGFLGHRTQFEELHFLWTSVSEKKLNFHFLSGDIFINIFDVGRP